MQKKSIDTILVFVVMPLVIFGMIMISSVSVYESFKITSRWVAEGKLTEASNAFYLQRNIFHVLLGTFLLIVFSKFTYSNFEKYSKLIYVALLSLLSLVLFIGTELNGAKGWLDIPGLPSIQPVEFAKVGLIIYIAYFLKRKRPQMGNFQEGFIPFFAISFFVFLLLALQPDFGSILILAPVIISLYFVGGGNLKYLGISLLVCIIGAVGVYSAGKVGGSDNKSKLSYISSRIDNFLQDNKTLFAKKDVEGKDYQIKQGLIAIGSGGFFGLGFGKSIQKFGYLPEVQGDFVFSVIIEELGLFGAFLLLSAYLIIVYRGYTISRRVKDPFGKYIAFGLSTLILVQVFINVGVNLNVIPLTGVTLPFVSYGGSSLISLMIGVGILLNISRYTEYTNHSTVFGKKRRISNEAF